MVVHCEGVSASVRVGCVVREARTLSPEELARDVEGLASHDDDLLAVQELLGHDRREAAKEMALAINDDLFANPSARCPFQRSFRRVDRPPDSPLGMTPSHNCLRANIQRAVAAAALPPGKTHNRLESRHRFRLRGNRQKPMRNGGTTESNHRASRGEEFGFCG